VRRATAFGALCLSAIFAGCSSTEIADSGLPSDAAGMPPRDAAAQDARAPDAAVTEQDAAAPDAVGARDAEREDALSIRDAEPPDAERTDLGPADSGGPTCRDLACEARGRRCLAPNGQPFCGECLPHLLESPAGTCEISSSSEGDLGCTGTPRTIYVDLVRPRLVASTATGATSLTVSSTIGFSRSDLALIIDLQGAQSGRFELVALSSTIGAMLGGNTLALARPLMKSFDARDVVVVQRVPQFGEVTLCAQDVITAFPWAGSGGGVVAFRARSVTLQDASSIHADAIGLRGGFNNELLRGFNGESYLGTPRVQSELANGGGGGAGTAGGREVNSCGPGCYQSASSSGGGGYGTPGGDGTGTNGLTGGLGGMSYGGPRLEALHLGSGAGGPGDGYGNNQMCGPPGYSTTGYVNAPAGGGIVWIVTSTLSLAPNARVSANGAIGLTGYKGACWDYGGVGGSAGGSVWIQSEVITSSASQVQALGGAGRPDWTMQTMSGAGGAGRIRLDYETLNGRPYPAASEESAISSPAPGFSSGL
jgi:hypothetical protein